MSRSGEQRNNSAKMEGNTVALSHVAMSRRRSTTVQSYGDKGNQTLSAGKWPMYRAGVIYLVKGSLHVLF